MRPLLERLTALALDATASDEPPDLQALDGALADLLVQVARQDPDAEASLLRYICWRFASQLHGLAEQDKERLDTARRVLTEPYHMVLTSVRAGQIRWTSRPQLDLTLLRYLLSRMHRGPGRAAWTAELTRLSAPDSLVSPVAAQVFEDSWYMEELVDELTRARRSTDEAFYQWVDELPGHVPMLGGQDTALAEDIGVTRAGVEADNLLGLTVQGSWPPDGAVLLRWKETSVPLALVPVGGSAGSASDPVELKVRLGRAHAKARRVQPGALMKDLEIVVIDDPLKGQGTRAPREVNGGGPPGPADAGPAAALRLPPPASQAGIFMRLLELEAPFSVRRLMAELSLERDTAYGALSDLRQVGLLRPVDPHHQERFTISPWIRTARARQVLEVLSSEEVLDLGRWCQEDLQPLRRRLAAAMMHRPGEVLVYCDSGATTTAYDFWGSTSPHATPCWGEVHRRPLPEGWEEERAAVEAALRRVAAEQDLRPPGRGFTDRRGEERPVFQEKAGAQLRFRPVTLDGDVLVGEARRRVGEAVEQSVQRMESELRWQVATTSGVTSIDIFTEGWTKAHARDHLLDGADVGHRRQTVFFGDRPRGNDADVIHTPLPRGGRSCFLFLSVGGEVRDTARPVQGLAADLGPGVLGAFLDGLISGHQRRGNHLQGLTGALAAMDRDLSSLIQDLDGHWSRRLPITLAFDINGTLAGDDGTMTRGLGPLLWELDARGYQFAAITGQSQKNLKGFFAPVRPKEEP